MFLLCSCQSRFPSRVTLLDRLAVVRERRLECFGPAKASASLGPGKIWRCSYSLRCSLLRASPARPSLGSAAWSSHNDHTWRTRCRIGRHFRWREPTDARDTCARRRGGIVGRFCRSQPAYCWCGLAPRVRSGLSRVSAGQRERRPSLLKHNHWGNEIR